jgi:hypothetical protein
MARVSRERGEVNARILYWGAEGAGKSASLRAAFDKLRPDHRGEIKQVPTRIDPTVGYEVLPISLGEIAGVRTQIEMIAVPGQKEQAPTRKQLLDQVDGVVFVADARAERAEANAAALHELRQALAAYGRSTTAATRPTPTRSRSCIAASAWARPPSSRRRQRWAPGCSRRSRRSPNA